jgi:dihydroxyacetone kinase DhaKLM complex PTS-EIIA-like component DhaM
VKICPSCSHKNREGSIFCEECGQNLLSEINAAVATKQIKTADEIVSFSSWGSARFDENTVVILHIRDSEELIRPNKRVILGRYDGSSSPKPDLDLTPHGALEKGVSRIHAAIYRTEDTLTLVDMGSSNGTMLNGHRLVRDQPRVLRDGDEIRLGKLVAHIYFKQNVDDP